MINIRTKNTDYHNKGLVAIMSEIAVQAAVVKSKLMELSRQAGTLAVGLQNAAPGEQDAPNTTIQYLSAIAEALQTLSERCDQIIDPGSAPSNNDVANRPKM
jgi:hypothetical protein